MNDAIHVDGVGFGYNETRVLDGLTLHIPGGATTAVVGANGSGKSTLLGLLAGTLFPQQGSIDAPRADGVAFAVQHSQVSDALPITVAETVMMGRWRALGLWRRPSREDRAIVDYWITELGLDDLRRRRLGTLSGGQRQRTLLAQAFAQESPVVLLDEPTVGLDADSRDRVARQIVRLAARGGPLSPPPTMSGWRGGGSTSACCWVPAACWPPAARRRYSPNRIWRRR